MVSEKAQRERVARAAGELVQEHGMEGATVDSIAARAGVTPSVFYGLFESEDAALCYAIRAGEQTLLQAIDGSGERERSWKDNVAAVLDAFLLAVHEDPLLAFLALVFRVADGLPTVGPCSPELVETLADALRPGPAGRPGSRSEQLVALGVLGVVAGRLQRGDDDLRGLGPELTELAIRVLAVPSRDKTDR